MHAMNIETEHYFVW